MHSVLITGGAGFIGQNLVHAWRAVRPADRLVVVDAMTYAANLRSLEPLIADRSILFLKGDIRDAALMRRLFDEHEFTRVVHLAAESHVDRSIVDPEAFLQTNVLGTFTLLEAARDAWRATSMIDRARFLHVSTDEVYGSLGPRDPTFTESSPYRPNSPYAASKAASDHLVRSFVPTYGMPALITNCSNNYGPYQHPEKRVGETYNVGGGNERNNRDVVGLICDALDHAFAADASLASRFPSCPAASGASCRSLMTYVTDRPGHDHRYAIDATKLAGELGNRCSVAFESGLWQTVRWYVEQENWWRDVTSGAYKAWIDKNYGFRIAV